MDRSVTQEARDRAIDIGHEGNDERLTENARYRDECDPEIDESYEQIAKEIEQGL